jgi:hypothetical protein
MGKDKQKDKKKGKKKQYIKKPKHSFVIDIDNDININKLPETNLEQTLNKLQNISITMESFDNTNTQTIEPVITSVEEPLPPVEPVITSVESVITSVEEVITLVEEVIPTVEPVIPTVEEVIPTVEEVIPTVEPVITPVEEVIPTVEEVIPTVEEVIPTVEEVITPVEPVIPAVEEVIPTVEEVIPTVEEVIPAVEEVIPAVEEVVIAIPLENHLEEQLHIEQENEQRKLITVTEIDELKTTNLDNITISMLSTNSDCDMVTTITDDDNTTTSKLTDSSEFNSDRFSNESNTMYISNLTSSATDSDINIDKKQAIINYVSEMLDSNNISDNSNTMANNTMYDNIVIQETNIDDELSKPVLLDIPLQQEQINDKESIMDILDETLNNPEHHHNHHDNRNQTTLQPILDTQTLVTDIQKNIKKNITIIDSIDSNNNVNHNNNHNNKFTSFFNKIASRSKNNINQDTISNSNRNTLFRENIIVPDITENINENLKLENHITFNSNYANEIRNTSDLLNPLNNSSINTMSEYSYTKNIKSKNQPNISELLLSRNIRLTSNVKSKKPKKPVELDEIDYLYNKLQDYIRYMHIDRKNIYMLVVKAMEIIENYDDIDSKNKKVTVEKAINRLVMIDLNLCDFDQRFILASLSNVIELFIISTNTKSQHNEKKHFDNDKIDDIVLANCGQIIHSLIDKLSTIILKKQYTADKLFVNMGTITQILMILVDKYKYLTGTEKKLVVLQALEKFINTKLEYLIELPANKKDDLILALDTIPLTLDLFIALQKSKFKINRRKVIQVNDSGWLRSLCGNNRKYVDED